MNICRRIQPKPCDELTWDAGLRDIAVTGSSLGSHAIVLRCAQGRQGRLS